jgi:hypothetical protein
MCKLVTGFKPKKCQLFLGRVTILASHTLAHLQAAQADTQTQACKRANFAIAPTNNDVSYLNCQAYPDCLTMNDNIFNKTRRLSKLSFVSLLSGLT